MKRSSPLRLSPPWSNPALFCGALAMILMLANSLGMVRRARHGLSDISIFYQSATLVNHGAGAQVYDVRGQIPGWYRCIPPVGLAFFQPLARFGPGVTGLGWMLLNWAMLGGALWMLQRFLGRLDHQKRLYASLFPWLAILLILMSVGSIQVGQFSVLFTMCWIGYLLASSYDGPHDGPHDCPHDGPRSGGIWPGLTLALPASIKIYPALMLMVPLSLKGRRSSRVVGGFVLGLMLFCGVIPLLFDGARVAPLSLSFLRDVVFNPHGRMSEDLAVGTVSNQGLESIFLRYGCADAGLHAEFPGFPHANWPRQFVLQLASAVRLALFLVSAAIGWRWRGRFARHPVYASMGSMALWSAALYLLMPGPKARYGIYAFTAFLPLVGRVLAAARLNHRRVFWLRAVLLVTIAMLILQLIPNLARAYGGGFVGALLLWGANLWLAIKESNRGAGVAIPAETAQVAARPAVG